MNNFYAHSTQREDQADWHGLSEHLNATGDLAAKLASHFDGNQLASVAGRLHDIGKYTLAFQHMIRGEKRRVEHSTHGSLVAIDKYGPLGRLLAYGIAGHHAGLANGRDAGARIPLSERLRSAQEPLEVDWKTEIQLPESIDLPDFKPVRERGGFQLSFLGRMLYSTLVDADFRDTEAFYAGIDGEHKIRTGFPSLIDLREELERTLGGFKGDTEVNKIRRRILDHARSQADTKPGIFSLTVPTGGGKTLTSLAFALDHAIRNGMRRVIYVIPFTSVVEQNAQVFRSSLGHLGDRSVLEHHSAYRDDRGKRPEAKHKLALAMENWEAPIVVTTAVQFFESLFADRPSRCRKLHNIANSVVILDEAQTLPLKLLRPCVAAIAELALNYRTSLILCTATQPALKANDGFKGGLQGVREIAPEPSLLFEHLKRVRLSHVGCLSDDKLIETLRQHDQVLCIVNNRRHARALYEGLADESGVRHLTTLMCARHRSEVLQDVRSVLKRGEPCRVVSTSLMEAGVDIDFPAVFRAEAGLDSIAQAAGRCNREGLRDPDASEVLVFAPDERWPPPPELKQFAQAGRMVFRHYPNDPLSLAAVHAYFRELYWQKGERELDAHSILAKIERGQLDNIPYETVAGDFRMIENTMLPIVIPYDQTAREALNGLRYADKVGGLARKLQPYLVQVPERGLKALKDVGAVQPVRPDIFGEQFMELVNQDLYDQHYGLNWDDVEFIKADSLVI